MVINLIDWILISRIFLKTNITTIKKVELIPNYKLSKVMGKKLQHDAKKPIHNFFSYQLCATTEMLLSCKGLNFLLAPKRLKFKNYLFPFELLNHAFLIMIINMSLLCTLKLKCWVVLMLDYHHIEFITERITVMKIYCRKNMTPLSASVKTKTILSRKQTKEHNCYTERANYTYNGK